MAVRPPITRMIPLVALVLVTLGLATLTPAPPAAADTGLTRYNWSVALGRIADVGSWLRNVDYRMTPATATSGRVSASFVQFDPTVAGQKTVIGHAGPCNGVVSCPIYTAVSSVTGTWTGSYTFNGNDNAGQLAITWDHGPTESWNITQLRANTLGRMDLVTAAYPGSDPNGGWGFGSKQPFSYYKTMGAVDSVPDIYYGWHDLMVEGTTAQYGLAWNLNVGGMNGSSTYPKGLLLLQSPNTSYPLCRDDLEHITGTMYLMWVTNGGRLMHQNNWRRCLVQAETGAYHGDMHVAMLNQVIDDNKNMVGVVGVESSAAGGWSLARVYALKA